MTITPEQVADLREGDVVELAASHWPGGTCWRGPLYGYGGELRVAGGLVRHADGTPLGDDCWSLTVVSRAPRPLYVNHPRTEPVPGDVARPEKRNLLCFFVADDGWVDQDGDKWASPPRPLRLLVDGFLGEVVP